MRFVDTNVLLYAISTDPAEAAKRRIANELLDGGDLALSVQVLQEFYWQSTRPTRRRPLSTDVAAGLVKSFMRFRIQSVTADLVVAAMEGSVRHQISYWDAAIIEAARALGCDIVVSEDLAHGQTYGGITVRNPFA